MSTETTNWEAYLPTEPLPDTGPKEWKTGQVWAFCDGPGDARVFRMVNPTATAFVVLAATNKHVHDGPISNESIVACRSVLICNAGETPPPPDVVFGRSSTPAAPQVDGGAGKLPQVGETWKIQGYVVTVKTVGEYDCCERHIRVTMANGRPNGWCACAWSDATFVRHASPATSPVSEGVPEKTCPKCEWAMSDCSCKPPTPQRHGYVEGRVKSYAELMADVEADEGVAPQPTCKSCGARGPVGHRGWCAACYAADDYATSLVMSDSGETTTPADPAPWVPDCDPEFWIPGVNEHGGT